MKTNRYILTLALTLCCAVGNLHAVDKSYYNSLNGKSGSTLREAMTALVYDKHTTGLGYNWVFDGIDWDSNGNVYDIYSDCGHTKNDATDQYKCCCDAINREHVVPQSTFGSKYPQYADRHHLFVVDGKANGYRSDYAFGECSGGTKGSCNNASTVKPSEGKATCTNHEYGKLGTSTFSEVSISDKVYEPGDEYKGDIARAIMYMVIRYATVDYCKVKSGSGSTSTNEYPVTAWSGSSNVGLMFSNSLSTNYGLSNYGKALLMKWHRADPPSAREIARNNGVEAKQGNRNPFIDLPDLAEYLWGTHAGESVPLSDLNIATGSGGGGSSSYQITLNRHGVTQTITCTGEYTLPTSSTEVAACAGWAFAGWSASSPVNTTKAPTFKNSVTSSDADKTFYAVYSHTATTSAPRRAKMGDTEVTFTPGTDTGETSVTKSNVTCTMTTMNNASYYQIYANASGTFTCSAGNITKIEFTCTASGTSKYGPGNTSANVGSYSYSGTTGTWTGSASSVTLSSTAQVRMSSLTITYSGGSSSTTYKTSPDCGTAHTITLSNGGSATGGDFFADVTSAYSGATVTLTAAPDDGYAFSSWSVTNASTSAAITVTNNQFTMPDANVNVSATFTERPKHTITFYINDKQVSQQTLSEGLEAEAPNVPACEGYTFVGWYPSSLATTNTTEYDWISNITVGNGDESFYAIYSKTSGGGGGSSNNFALYSGTLTAGDYLLVYSGAAMNKTVSSDRFGYESVTANNNVITTTDATIIWRIAASGNYWTIYNAGEAKYAASTGAKNKAQLLSDGTDDKSLWSCTSSSSSTSYDFVNKKNTANSVNATLRKNDTYGFACYASTTGGALSLYKRSASSGTTYYTSATGCDATADCTGKLATPNVTATGSDGKITLSWLAITGATDYEVTIGAGAGYTTECGSAAVIGSITGTTTKQCVITGLTNGLAYTTSVKAIGSTTCDSDADEDTATPVECNPWTDPTIGWGTYSLSTSGTKTATFSVSGTTHGTRSFESSNTDVLTVANNGTVTAQGAGTATVTVHWTAADGYCAKDVTSQTFTVSGTLVITYDKNDGSATPATTTQNVTYNVGATLKPSNTFTREGYTFLGWGTARDGSKVYDGGQTGVKFTEATTLYAIWQVNNHQVSYVVTPAAGATVQINSSATTPQNANYGSTVTISISPAAHYTLTSVTAKDADNGNVTVSGTGNTRTLVMPDKNVTVTVTMTEETKFTVNWYVAGTPTAETNYAGVALAGITDPTIDCNDKVFVGWTATANYSHDTNAPADLFTNAGTKTMPSNNTTNYYAVFAEENSGGGTQYKLVSELTNAKDYIFVTRNTAGDGYAFSSAITTGTSVTIQTSGSDLIVSGTPANSIIWTAATGWSLTTKDDTKTNKVLKINGSTFALDATGSNNLAWTTDYGLNGKSSGTTKYYLQCTSDGTFSKSTTTGSTTNRVWAYEKSEGGGTTYSGYTTSCVAPSTVTVTFNANGGTGTMADQVVDYNTATALNANTFTRTGYSFDGWALTADGSKVYDNQQPVTLTKNTTLYALWTINSYNVSFSTPTGATAVTVNGQSSSPQSVEFGSTVTIAITPAVTHTIGSVTASGGVVVTNNGNNTYSFTMPASNVTVTVTMSAKPVYAIRFFDGDTQIGATQNIVSGQAATKPATDPAGCEEYTFVGWWTATLADDNTTTYTWVTDFTNVTSAQDYYAVYRHVDDGAGGSGEVTFNFTDIASANSWAHDSNHPEVSITPVTLNVTKGSASYQGRWWNTDKTWRIYSGNTVTVTCSSGDVTSVSSNPSKTFTISEGEATFSGAANFTSITVNYGGATTYYVTSKVCDCTTPTLTFDQTSLTKYAGDAAFINPLTVEGNDLHAALTFSSSNTNKATVDNDGKVTILQALSSNEPITITATLAKVDKVNEGDPCQAKATASYTLNIYNKITWSVNGTEYTTGDPTTYTTQGGSITAYPTDPDGASVCGGKTFIGWTTSEVDETDTPPATLYNGLSSMSGIHHTASTTYYAVFAEQTTSSGVQKEIFLNVDSVTSSYGTDTELTRCGVTCYFNNIMKKNDGTAIQMKASTGYVANKTALGGIDSIVVNGVTDLTVYGGTSAKPTSTTITGVTSGSNAKYDFSGGSYSYFEVKNGISNARYPSSIKVYYSTSATTYKAYSTYCGPTIRAQEVERLTSTKDQTVKSQAITVKGSSLDGSTLTASITGTDALQFTCSLAATAITAGAIETTYTINYTPTVYAATHEATLTFSDGTTESDPITLRGRSLPEQFAIVAYDGSKYYVLDGTMTGEAKVVRPIEVTVSGGEVTMCPARAVYTLTQLATPNQNVHLVGQAGRLYGAGSNTGLNTKSLTSTSGTDWLLTTSNFDTYHVTNATSPTRGIMYYETNNAFGHYATSMYGTAHYFGDIRLMPIGTICTCLDAPVATATPHSTSATISWSAVANAIRYDVTCSGGSVSVSGTTATITGLTGNTTYTYSVKAVASGADCSLSYNDSFTTSSCDDVPQDVRVTPNVKEAIIRWTAEAEHAKVILYSDAECTTPVKTIDPADSPCTVEGLDEDTRYYVKVFAGQDKTCESSVVTFSTLTTAVELVEWLTDGVKILLTGDDQTASIYIEDKQENAGSTTTKVAEDIFFSKYFEASGYTKLVGLFNGTDHSIDISDLVVCSAKSGAWSTTKASGTSHVVLADITKLKNDYGDGDKIMLPKNTEIILYSLRDDNKSDFTGAGCMDEHYNWDDLAANSVQNWYRIGKTNEKGSQMDNDGHYPLTFGGANSIALKRDGVILDLIGAGTSSGATDTKTECNTTPHTIGNGRTINTPNDSYGFFCEDGMAPPSEEYPEGYTTFLTTNRGFLMRKNEVVSGANAVEKNKTDFVTLCEEWVGVPIGNDGSAAERSCLSGDQFGYVGSYDYDVYYAQFDSVTTITELENHKNEDGTITIPVEDLSTLSCSKLRITVFENGEEKASKEYQVPIMIASGTTVTTDDLFVDQSEETCATCDVVVFSGAKLQKGEEASGCNAIHDLTLYPGSTLDLPSGKGNYSVNSITYRVEGDNVPITCLSDSLWVRAETQQLIVTRRITNDRYYFISLPYACNVADIRLSNGTPATNGVDFRLMEYDGEARALEGSLAGTPGHWKMVTDDVLEAGKGYAIAVSSKKPKEIVFPMTLPSGNLTREEIKKYNTVDLKQYIDPSGNVRETNYNWNLIAHPYITKFEVTADAANVEALWENPSRENTGWIDDWKTWEEEDPTQNPDTTGTHTGNIVMNGTVENGIDWVLYEDGSMELTGGGQMVDFSALDAVPWAVNRQLIKSVKIGGDVQKIGKYAFGQCTNLTNVIIAAPVTNLASQAFAGCTGLRTLRIESTQYVSATTTTFDGISSLTMISLYVPQSMYNQYNQNTPWNKMAISAFDDGSTTGGDGTNTHNPSPRRAVKEEDEDRSTWKKSDGGIYVTIPAVENGKVIYNQSWIEDVPDIPPFTAVFIQGDGMGEITFTMPPSDPGSGSGGGEAPKRNKNVARNETKDYTIFVGVTLTGNSTGKHDLASLRLRPDFGEHYKFNLDLLKFTVFNTERPQLYFKTPNDQLAFRAISDSLAKYSWIPMGVYCRDAGTYTFSLYDRYVLDEVEAVYLHDNETGTTTNLLFGNYTIETTKQLYTNTRFSLNVLLRREKKVDVPTFVEQVENPNAPHKFIRDGVMYIMRDGRIFDLTGKPAFDNNQLLNR